MPKLPENIGKYKILERLGRGGMSVVYKAEHPTLKTPVVLKKLMLKGDAAHRERFRREASLMMLLRHENVVGVFDHFKEGSGYYLVMEFVDGRTLSELLAREGAMEADEALWLIGKISLALAHIHYHGIVHRDVKPSNVLLRRDGTVKLADFGIAFTPGGGEDITAEGTALGTPSFMAPEQLEDARGADERSDMWSLGVCCFELLTGRKFISGPTPAAIREALPDAVRNMSLRLPPGLPAKAKRLLRKTLRMKSEARIRDGQAAVRLLGAEKDSPKPPEGLRKRLDGLISSLEPPADPTPEAAADPDPSIRLAAIRSLLSSSHGGNEASRKETKSRGRTVQKKKKDRASGKPTGRNFSKLKMNSLPFSIAVVVAVLFFLLVLVPGAWERTFLRNSHGIFSLRLVFPDEAPDFWLTGADVRIFREGDESLKEVSSPGLRPDKAGKALVSREISLPSGAYRISWSLGDAVSWHSFLLPTVAESLSAGGDFPVLEEELGFPPSFPLQLDWSVRSAVDETDLSSLSGMSWERIDKPEGGLESGGQYRFRFSAGGYRDASFSIAVSPWRRNLRIDAALLPLPGNLTLRNDSERTATPRLNHSGRYSDLSDSPVIRRIGRLPAGEERHLILLPGEYSLAPGYDRKTSISVSIESGGSALLVVEADEEGDMKVREVLSD